MKRKLPTAAAPKEHALRPVCAAARGGMAVWGLVGLGLAPALHAQEAGVGGIALQPLQLRPSLLLQENLDPAARESAPSFLTGDRVEGKTDGVTRIEGQAELRRHDTVIRADQLQYDQASDTARATGNVLINRAGTRYEGQKLELKLDTNQGYFEQPTYSLIQNGGHGGADRVDFVDKDTMVARNASYTTCTRRPGPSWLPDWVVTASSIEFDQAEEVGHATNGMLRFMGVPLLAAPYLSFPLTDKRKSGLLPPTINLDNLSGLELTLPYYLNLSPNSDATLYPTLMSRRGIDFAGEYRYLEDSYNGQVRGAFMPNDKLRNANRWAASVQHNQVLQAPGQLGAVGLRVNLNRVSDDDYWRDFPRTSTSLTSRLLASDAVVNWQRGPWALSAGAFSWQTLQDVSAPIIAPYDRLPSLAARYRAPEFALGGLGGLDASVYTEYTRFRADRPQVGTDINGTRAMAVAEISRTWQTPGWYVRPRAQLHATHYQLESPLGNGSTTASRVLPTFSVDSGLFFERDTRFFGKDLTQTLEPRAFYVHTPYRDQSLLPNYDSAAFDFNLATVYSENPFGGNDRIADLHALTVGVTSRLIDPGNGRELVRFGVAQRLRFRNQEVFLPGGAPSSDRLSDILLGTRLNWDPRWAFEGNVQFNPQDRRSVRTTLSGRYSPGDYRVVSAAYRLQRGTSEQVDVGWQWPLSAIWGDESARRLPGGGLGEGRWYSVGRINYSVPDNKVVDLVAGFEYDGGCWIGRVVLESLQRSTASTNRRILFQLEFVGFSRIGSNPLKTLKENVPRYQYLREEISAPSRFGRYD